MLKFCFTWFVVCLWLTTVQAANADLDCSIYTDDIDIVNLNPFYVRLYFYDDATSVSYSSRRVTAFNIVRVANPNLNTYCLKNLQALKLISTNLPISSLIKNFQGLTSLIIRTDNGTVDEHLPSELGQLRMLLTLELTDIKNLEDLPDEIEYLTQLKSLTLNNIPNFNNIPDESIGKLRFLNTLSLVQLPNLSRLPTTMNNFQLLQQLEVTNTNIPNIELKNLTSLSTLKLSSNAILETIEITDMLRLLSIDIQNNLQLRTLNITNLSSLNSFTIASNAKLSSLNIESLPSIKQLSVSSSDQLQTVTLKNLVTLNDFRFVSLAQLESISFDNTPALTSVAIQSSSILKTISFNNAPAVQTLDLSGCQLTVFPDSILTLTSLKKLVLTSNQLSALPVTLSTDLPNLRILYLDYNRFQGNIFQPALQYVSELYLNHNLLTSLNGIDGYKSLQHFEIDYNIMSSIPIEILTLSSTLQFMSINYNQITTIPYAMSNLRTLNTLSLISNSVTRDEQVKLFGLFQQTSIKLYI